MSRNKTILKNTLVMYARMAILLLLSLFTARIVFNTLGEENYGIYNLVAGIIVFFSFLNSGLSNATRRYLTAEIEVGDQTSKNKIFNMCIMSHVLISIIVLFLAETVGLWFVMTQLNIPEGRGLASLVVYQLSVITAIIGIMQTPYQATIIAYEKMSIYAYFTIFDVVFKLLIILLIQYLDYDKLIVYALLVFVSGLTTNMVYFIYCNKKFELCKLRFYRDFKKLKEIFSFTGWSLFGQAAVVSTNQGVSVLINIYTSVVVNAAMGVANTISNVVNGFITNFQTAFNPAITKSYVANETEYLNSLVIRASKISSFLLLVFAIPIIFECDSLLTIWLGSYPKYSTEFCRLSFGYLYLEAVSAPLWMVIYSDTNIKRYQIATTFVYSFNFILSWVLLFAGFAPYSVVIVRCIVNVLLMAVRLLYCRKFLCNFNIVNWMRQVLLKGFLIGLLTAILPMWVKANTEFSPFFSVILTTIISVPVSLLLMYTIGLNQEERLATIKLIKRKILHR